MTSIYLRAAGLAIAGCLFLATQPGLKAQDANRETIVTATDVGGVVDRLAKRTGDFKEEFDNAVEHSDFGKRMEERAKHRADDLHDSAKKLRDVFNDKRDKNNPDVRSQVDKTLAMGAEINRLMQDHRFTDKLQQNWDLLHSDLNALAAVYNLSPIQ